jgi:PIN domain nuclease of toxin-antitoxin system
VILVDTHVVIWLTQNPSQLSKAAEKALIEGRKVGALAIADITLREIAMLVAANRVIVSSPLEIYLQFIESLFQVLPINAQIAAHSTRFGDAFPKDPADRLIGATAIVHGARLITKDEVIRRSGEVNCVW